MNVSSGSISRKVWCWVWCESTVSVWVSGCLLVAARVVMGMVLAVLAMMVVRGLSVVTLGASVDWLNKGCGWLRGCSCG